MKGRFQIGSLALIVIVVLLLLALMFDSFNKPSTEALDTEASLYAGKMGWTVEERAPGWVSSQGRKGALNVSLSTNEATGCTFTVWPCPDPEILGERPPIGARFARGRLQRQATRNLAESIEETIEHVERLWSLLSVRWEALSAADGIVLTRRALEPQTGRISLAGQADGVPFAVELSSLNRSLTVTAQLPAALPGQVVARGRAPLGATVLRLDPILSTVADVCGSDPDRLQAVLAVEAVRAPLVEVVHRFPGSVVSADAVELVAPEGGADLVALVQLACELAGVLGAQLARTERQPGHIAQQLRDRH